MKELPIGNYLEEGNDEGEDEIDVDHLDVGGRRQAVAKLNKMDRPMRDQFELDWPNRDQGKMYWLIRSQ